MQATFELKREKDDKPLVWRSADNRTPPHFHSNIELVYVLSGEITITINGVAQVLKKGDVSAALSYDIHAYHTDDRSDTYVVIIPATLVRSFILQSQGCSFENPVLRSGAHSSELKYCIEKMMNALHREDNLLKAKGYAYTILSTISAQLKYAGRDVSTQQALPRRILLHIQDKYTEPLTLDAVATYFGYNKQYFSRFFSAYFGCGLHDYINNLRAQRAGTLLRETDMTVSEIALEAGFENQRTFNRAFRRVFEDTPVEFRKKWCV